ncbi:MAG TPA: GNAT family N-acetyltransferase [Thermotogota bacterium]|nr:GNAT family N-acetyltransferase [Thermotogota bacterium]HRW92067.1 GNAT family N-acetyltransferase [Thermotogota bacterium]
MKNRMHIVPLLAQHIHEATLLVLSDYSAERRKLAFLPEGADFAESIENKLKELVSGDLGFAAFEGGRMVGFLTGVVVPDFFGKVKGIYSPLQAHAVLGGRKREIYPLLYTTAAASWVKKELVSHSITLFAQDSETIDTWFWLGFGNRCVDSICQTKDLPDSVLPDGFSIRKAQLPDLDLFPEVHRKHANYYSGSPLFMYSPSENNVEHLKAWLSKENRHIWFVQQGNKVIGYMRLQRFAESYVADHSSVMNITGAFVEEAYRGRKIGKALLSGTKKWLLEKEYPLLGVDFESFNIFGSRFWNRYFTPYTFSMVRRIDERILHQATW